jgi:ABC-type branched-subunit amino acid transport system substrate-binding protein
MVSLLTGVLGLSLVVACGFPGSVKPTIKIGLSAPFEGRYRDLGYEALHAVRLAVQQRNEAGGIGGRYLVELVALNDFNDTEEAIVQARKMAVDAGVLGVLGGWSPKVGRDVVREYERLSLVVLCPETDFTEGQSLPVPHEGFESGYQILSGGVAPGPVAAWAYTEANRLLDGLEAATRADGRPTRLGVRKALEATQGDR